MFDFLLNVLIIGAIYGVSAISLNLQAGVSGLMNFGQIAFYGIGGYSVALAAGAGYPLWAGALAGLALAVAAGALVGRLGRNLQAEYWAIATLGLAEILRIVLINESGAGGIGGAIALFPGLHGQAQLLAFLAVMLTALVAAWLLARRLTEHQFGRILRLMREQPELSMSFGHDIVAAKVRIMMAGAAIGALSGALSVAYIAYISPGDLMSVDTFLIWTMVIVGGIGNHFGVVLGAFLLQFISVGAMFLQDAFAIPSNLIGALRMLVIGVLLLAFLMLRPEGAIPERLRKFHAED